MIAELQTEVAETECTVRLYNWTPYRPAYISGAPENCYPAEGGYGDWALFVNDQRAEWLEVQLTPQQIESIEAQLFNMMEQS
jgi:hypothetical protein